jgi:hypothetical protein
MNDVDTVMIFVYGILIGGLMIGVVSLGIRRPEVRQKNEGHAETLKRNKK